jgi:hypothetical protein
MKKLLLIFLGGGFLVVLFLIFLFPKKQPPSFAPEPEIINPQKVELDQRFGFLSSERGEDFFWIVNTGAGWVRPHPGPFIWGKMQKGPNEEIDFRKTDHLVKEAQKYGINLLITLWPYAEWDQKDHPPEKNCQIKGDEFSPEFGNFRCNPYHWSLYEQWVAKVVERYDGDGKEDMPDLKKPIKFWEVFNEPDLGFRSGSKEQSLVFYQEGPSAYAELLKRTSQKIKEQDQEAKVLIAGAAGGLKESLDFYRQILTDPEVQKAFDIANVHCISNDDISSFNVKPYLEMLKKIGLKKPLWVTEAEAFISPDPLINATQLKLSTKKALALGAEKIFYTAFDFRKPPGEGKFFPLENKPKADLSLNLKDPQKIYQAIFKSL